MIFWGLILSILWLRTHNPLMVGMIGTVMSSAFIAGGGAVTPEMDKALTVGGILLMLSLGIMGASNWSTSQTVSFATACSGAVCTVQDTGLSSGTEFQFRIVAVNLGGDSDYSNIASNWTITAPPSGFTEILILLIN